MKIKQTYIGFTESIDMGRYGLFINVDNYGIETDIKEIINQAIHFPRVIFIGKPLEQKDEIEKFVKRCLKINPEIIIEINTDGTIKPVGLNSFYENIIYNVCLQLKNSNKQYSERIKESVINWFTEVGANFKFNISNIDDIDEVKLLSNNLGIKRNQIFLLLTKINDEMIKQIKVYGYNITFELDKKLWRN